MLVKRIKELEKAVNDIVAPQKSIFQKGKRWLFENSFGTVDHLRVELMTRYETKRIRMKVDRGAYIDCMFLMNKPDEVS